MLASFLKERKLENDQHSKEDYEFSFEDAEDKVATFKCNYE
jgi:hypothetical protein